ncbi:hypothetical protein [Thermophilibacter provencensis]|uniref:pEK499-p136 HEPN domain-containing protein n=1 Tax=Thermophilibacter provencensis TaxID=1852386 RepID=A0ABT7V508_9ACTN|nr:hypothetical protein [Thermophilibacter provencensis]MDM8271571.1 hypothetical protein [Thermophilibacter provencensis]
MDYRCSLTERYSPEEFARLVQFYVLDRPFDQKVEDRAKTLEGYGWKGNPQSTKLERLLLQQSGIQQFIILGSNSIKETLKIMKLDEEICADHPRALLHRPTKIKLNEDGSITRASNDNRMQCLLKNIRNGIAHGQTYIFPNGAILLEDKADEGAVTARILVRKESLLNWIDVIQAGSQKT